MRNPGPGKYQTLLYMHLHKTGGTTMTKLLDNFYKKEETYNIKGKSFRDSIKEFKELPAEQKRKYRLIKGHQFFGLHEFLPQACAYITMLREPLKRVLSNYYWALERPNLQYYGEVTGKSMGFEEFMHSGMGAALDNGMTRFISGYDLDRVPYGQCAEDMLKAAKNNLKKHFLAVGLNEDFDKSLILFKRILGWQEIPFYRKYNITMKKPSEINIPKPVYNSIKKYIELDIELYKFGGKMFAEQTGKMDVSFREEVKLFKRLNLEKKNNSQHPDSVPVLKPLKENKGKRVIKKFFRGFGYEIRKIDRANEEDNKSKKRDKPGRRTLREVLRNVQASGFQPETIIDVGVNMGTPQLYDTFLDAKYILVEPLEESRVHMEKICKKLANAEYVMAAASAAKKKVILNVHDDFGGSSLYKESDGPAADGFQREVKGLPLDTICREKKTKGPYIIKIDTQGAETDVLTGAEKILAETEVVIMEASLFQFYREGPQFHDVVSFMKERGFVVYDILGGSYRPIDGALAQVDLVFVKEKGRFRTTHRFATAEQRQKMVNRMLKKREKP